MIYNFENIKTAEPNRLGVMKRAVKWTLTSVDKHQPDRTEQDGIG